MGRTEVNGTRVLDGSRELLQRVATGPHFEKSRRLRDLLLYLGDRALQDPHCTLHEQEIGVDVLGRPADYDTSHDTLVRVSVSQLRKKLEQHFTTDGREEPVIIDIPKGSYIPVFRPREEPIPHRAVTIEQPLPSRRPLLTGMLAGMVVMGAVWGMSSLFGSARTSASQRPAVEEFWTQLLGNGQPTYLVVSDVNLIEFQNLIGRSVPLSEYEAHEFDQMAERFLSDPAQRVLARRYISRVPTSVSDVQVARDFGMIASGKKHPLNIVSARDASSALATSQNTILLGSLRANPWVGLFDDQLAFQTEYHETPPSMRFINRSPLPGEDSAFSAVWRRTGYCRVAYRANPNRTGFTLVVSGSDVISTEAGGRFLTSEDWMRQLRQKLGLKSGAPMPYFEVLLRTVVVNNTIPRFEMVAYRPHK